MDTISRSLSRHSVSRGVSMGVYRGLSRGVAGASGGFQDAKFSPHYDADPLEADIPSNKAYPRGRTALDTVSVSAGAEYSLDGVNWTAVVGVWGTSKFVLVRGPAHADFSTAIIHTVYFNEGEIDEVSIDFTIWTMANPATIYDRYLNTSHYTGLENYA